MRWFMRPFEDEDEDAWPKYRAHLQAIEAALPDGARALAELDLHDALFDGLEIRDVEQTVQLALVRGDLQQSYSRVVISYSKAACRSPGADTRWLVSSKKVEVLAHELDVTDDGFVHRLLCWPAGELHVTFDDVEFVNTPRADPTDRSRSTRRRDRFAWWAADDDWWVAENDL